MPLAILRRDFLCLVLMRNSSLCLQNSPDKKFNGNTCTGVKSSDESAFFFKKFMLLTKSTGSMIGLRHGVFICTSDLECIWLVFQGHSC